MLVVVNIDPGSTLNELMTFLTERSITFSFTDHLSKLCDKSVIGERHDYSSQTDAIDSEQPPNKKFRPTDGYASPCSSATPSDSTTSSSVDNSKYPAAMNDSRKDVDVNEEVEEEDEEMSNDFMQSELMKLMLAKIKTDADAGLLLGGSEDNDEDSVDIGDMSAVYAAVSPAAIRFKPTYASTKRGVCQVCNREVSLITTHRKRHAITHLGFKTLKCAVCHKYFSRQDLASGHFKKDHPDAEYTPFLDTMSTDDEKQLSVMMTLCFPDKTHRKRVKPAESNGSKKS